MTKFLALIWLLLAWPAFLLAMISIWAGIDAMQNAVFAIVNLCGCAISGDLLLKKGASA